MVHRSYALKNRIDSLFSRAYIVTDVTHKRKITAMSPLRGFNVFAIVSYYKYVAPIGAFYITYFSLYFEIVFNLIP